LYTALPDEALLKKCLKHCAESQEGGSTL